MWNNNNQGYPGNHRGFPSPGAPPPNQPPGYGTPPFGMPAPGFPSPGGPPGGATGGYSPGYSSSYAPPPMPSPSGGFGSYAPPPGAHPGPPGPPPPNVSTYPGQQQSGAYRPSPPIGGFPAPPGPSQGGYNTPPGPPPGPPSVPPRFGGGPPPPIPSRNSGPGQASPGYTPRPGAPIRPPSQEQHYGPKFEGANHQQQQPYFKYSQCTGKKKALCIGINYVGQDAELKGCINDAQNVQRFLCTRFGYKAEDIVMLTDDAKNPRQIPTKQNIIQAMQWLVRGAQPNDSLFIHFSGHGGQTKDLDGDEADGFDEVIYPVDFKQNGHILDDTIHDIMVKSLPAGCRLTAIFDCCHSGSGMDLPYIYSTEGKVKEPNLAAEAGQGLLSAVTSYARGDMGGVFKSVSGLIKTATGSGQRADKVAKETKTSPADVISWSGCKDSQTSADAFEAGQATGAMSYAFITALTENPQQSYQQLLTNIRSILKAKYSQKPQLSSSHPMDTNVLFIC